MRESDLPRVKDVDRQLVGPHRGVVWPLRTDAHWWVYRAMPNFVAEVGDEVVGFLLGDFRGAAGGETSGWIEMLGVVTQYQGMGIGHKLVDAFCEECRKENVRARVVVAKSDPRLTRFWRDAGFHEGDLVSYER